MIALFCNLGRRMRLRGSGLGDLFAVRRLHRAIDRAQELTSPQPFLLAAGVHA